MDSYERLGVFGLFNLDICIIRSVCIFVESPEHGRALRNLLPGWQLLDASISAGEGRSLNCSIVTSVHAHRLDEINADVVIRADGGAAPLELPGSPRSPTTLVIDALDDSDQQSIDATRCRLRDYTQRGWTVKCPTGWMHDSLA